MSLCRVVAQETCGASLLGLRLSIHVMTVRHPQYLLWAAQ